MFRLIGSICERIFVLIFAVIAAQAPLFMQQYEQQLVGRIAELKSQVNAIQLIAGSRGVPAYIAKFLESNGPDFAAQGKMMTQLIGRFDSLQKAQEALSTTNLFQKPFVFLAHLKWDIAGSTYQKFSLGLPLTFEGAAYAVIGLLIGMGLFRTLSLLLNVPRKRIS